MVPHWGVIYDVHSLALRRVISPDNPVTLLLGVYRLTMHERICLVQKSEVDGMSLIDLGMYAVRRAAGREPPDMDHVHAMDAWALNLGDPKHLIR